MPASKPASLSPLSIPLEALCAEFGAELISGGHFPVARFLPLASAQAADAAFVVGSRYEAQLLASQAGCVVLPRSLAHHAARFSAVALADNPYLFFAQTAQRLLALARRDEVPETIIHPSAVVHPSAVIGLRVRIGPGSVLEADVRVGDDADLGAMTMVGRGSQIGAAALLHPRVTIGSDVTIGDRVVIQSGAVIGSDGFGFAPAADRSWVKIPQTGGVVIGNDVEIGANTVIDRGTLAPTIIEDGVKLDNLIQIAHNVTIGAHTAMAACSGVAGSAKIGRHCQIGGATGIAGHISLADNTVIGPMSLVMAGIDDPAKFVGAMPLMPEREWARAAVLIRRLPELQKTVRRLAARLKLSESEADADAASPIPHSPDQ